MKRFLSFLAAASLLVGFTACSDSDPDPEWDPKDPETSFTQDPNAPYVVLAEGERSADPIAFVPTTPWKLSVVEMEGTKARATREGEDATEYFTLVRASDNKEQPIFSGDPTPTEQVFYLKALKAPAEGGVMAMVQYQKGSNAPETVYKAFVGDTNDKPAFAVYAAVAAGEDSDEIFSQDENGNWIYEETPTTTLQLLTDAYGEKGYFARFKVEAGAAWVFTEKPFWLTIFDLHINYAEGGAEGVSEFSATLNDLQPIKPETAELVFSEDNDGNAQVLGTVTVSAPGCGDNVSFFGAGLPATAIFNASGAYYNENSETFQSEIPLYFDAAYGSKIFFVSKENWIDFAEELVFAETDEATGIDLTKYGIQRVGSLLNVELNDDEPRTAYLIAIPANTENIDSYSAEDALDGDGLLKEAYQPFLKSTLNQIPAAPSDANALVKWQTEEDEEYTVDGVTYTRSKMAEISTIRPANDADSMRTRYFEKEWALAPVAYEVHYNCIEASGLFGITVPEHETIEYYDAQGPNTEDPATTIKWAYADGSGTSLNIAINYDFIKDEWICKEQLDALGEIDWTDFPSFFVLKDKEGKVITWIMFTLDPVHYETESGTNPNDEVIAGAHDYNGKQLPLTKLTAGEEGYTDLACPHYKLELSNVWTVGFDQIPDDDYVVFESLEDGEPTSKPLFTTDGYGYYYINEDESVTSGSYYVVFGDLSAPTCVLYVVYSDGTTGGGSSSGSVMIGKASNPNGMGGTFSDITVLQSGDEGYEDMGPNSYPQYAITIRQTGIVQFETLPDYDTIEVYDEMNPHDDWFSPNEYMPGSFYLYEGDDNVKFWVYFKKGGNTVCSLYVDYQY